MSHYMKTKQNKQTNKQIAAAEPAAAAAAAAATTTTTLSAAQFIFDLKTSTIQDIF